MPLKHSSLKFGVLATGLITGLIPLFSGGGSSLSNNISASPAVSNAVHINQASYGANAAYNDSAPLALSLQAAAKKNTLQQSPIVVELYQSQGCSSCPPANLALNTVTSDPNVIALNFSVTYWDRLGWKDIFGDQKYTDRQVAYARTLRERNVYTPQVVINGTRAIVGNRPGELKQAINNSRKIYGGPSITGRSGVVNISKANNKQFNTKVWLVRYDPRTQNVAIKTGENGGRTLPHKNIVRELNDLGYWTGQARSITLPKAEDSRWKDVILVQNMGTGKILSAAKIS